MTNRLAAQRTALKSNYNVVVVGSGYGGSIAACRLARTGRSVCLLERGAERVPGEYPNDALGILKDVQFDAPSLRAGSRSALFDIRYNDDVNVVVGCGLGGTSQINAGICLRPDPVVFQSKAWPTALKAAGALDRYYEIAEAMLRPALAPEAVLRSPKTSALNSAAGALGKSINPVPILVNFDSLPGGANHVGVEQNPCVACGDCVSGCNYGAKSTLIMNYLPEAKAHGAEIFVDAQVGRLERSDTGWTVRGTWIDAGEFSGPLEIVAETVILAAGTLGSTEILMRSHQEGLPLSERLGSRFSGNGDMIGFAYNTNRAIDGVGLGAGPPRGDSIPGPCSTAMIDLRGIGKPSEGLVIEDGVIPGGLAPLLAPFFTLEGKTFGSGPSETLADVVRGAAREVDSNVRGSYGGAVNDTLFLLAMAHDDSRGGLFLQDDRLRASYSGLGGEPQLSSANDILAQLSHALVGTFVPNPIWNALTRHNMVTGHPLGGCPMADRAEDGVVNDQGQVYCGPDGTEIHRGLHVVDGSIVPTSLGVNPLMTISALAERCCDLLIKAAPQSGRPTL
jgi:cholesterol oxidase